MRHVTVAIWLHHKTQQFEGRYLSLWSDEEVVESLVWMMGQSLYANFFYLLYLNSYEEIAKSWQMDNRARPSLASIERTIGSSSVAYSLVKIKVNKRTFKKLILWAHFFQFAFLKNTFHDFLIFCIQVVFMLFGPYHMVYVVVIL